MTKKAVSIIIPAYNEGKTIHLILDKVRDVELMNDLDKEIIIVNDCSSDDTSDAVKRYQAENQNLNIRLLEHTVNQGKGAALHTGIAGATGKYVLIQDADLEYDPFEYNDLLRPLEEDVADVVYGSRFMGGKPHRILFFWHTIGNKFLTLLSNAFTNLNLTDMETCYKVFRREILDDLKIEQNRFGFEPEFTAKLARAGHQIVEVPITYKSRGYNEGKKIGLRDAANALWCIAKYSRG